MSHESLVRSEAERRGWKIERRKLEIGAVGVPCFIAPGRAGHCEIWVGIKPDSDELHVSHDWQQQALHVANVRGLSSGLYNRSGVKFTDGIIKDDPSSCTLSIKREGRSEYEDAWEALNTYIQVVYSLFISQPTSSGKENPRPYKFDVLGDHVGEAVEWRSLLTTEHVTVVGLGGVGAWIADFAAKSDAREVHGWDYDCIEPKNILRMPGALDPRWIGRPKAEWFQQTYCKIRNGVHGHNAKICSDNVQNVFEGTTFAFVAVDHDKDRIMVCDFLADAEIPFVVAGLSLVRQDKRVKVGMRMIIAHPGLSDWKLAIPQVGRSGQDDYGSLDIPDVYSMAAGWAVQSWRKMRGQVWQNIREECLDYRADDQILIMRGALK